MSLYKSLYDFRAEEPDELSFRREEVMEIISKDQDPWWIGRNMNGNDGFVPSNYFSIWSLPPGWKSASDPDSGDTYYYDDNGNVQWDPPGMASPRGLTASEDNNNLSQQEDTNVSSLRPQTLNSPRSPKSSSSNHNNNKPPIDDVISPVVPLKSKDNSTNLMTVSTDNTMYNTITDLPSLVEETPTPTPIMSKATSPKLPYSRTGNVSNPTSSAKNSGSSNSVTSELKTLAKYRQDADMKIQRLKDALVEHDHQGGTQHPQAPTQQVPSSRQFSPKAMKLPASNASVVSSLQSSSESGYGSPIRSIEELEALVDSKVRQRMQPLMQEIRNLMQSQSQSRTSNHEMTDDLIESKDGGGGKQPHIGSSPDRNLTPSKRRIPRLNMQAAKSPLQGYLPSLPEGPHSTRSHESNNSHNTRAHNHTKSSHDKHVRGLPPLATGNHVLANGGVRYSRCRSVVYPPSDLTEEQQLQISRTPPQSDLKLQYVHGYDGDLHKHGGASKRKNVRWLADGRVVYPAAAVVVILDVQTNLQAFFTGHSEEVTAIAVHHNGDFIASAQMGRGGRILLWSAGELASGKQESQESIELLLDASVRTITEVDFSPDGQFLAVLGYSEGAILTVFDWSAGVAVASAKLGETKVSQMGFNPYLYSTIALGNDEKDASPSKKGMNALGCYTIITCGARVVKFWSLRKVFDLNNDNDKSPGYRRKNATYVLEGNAGTMNRSAASEHPDMTCFCCVADPTDNDSGIPMSRVFVGTSSGSVFVWQQNSELVSEGVYAWQPRGRLISVVTDVHDGPIIDLDYTGPTPYDNENKQDWIERLISCSKDGIINVWHIQRKNDRGSLPFEHLASADISAPGISIGYARSLSFDAYSEAVIVGTTGNSVCLLLGPGLIRASTDPATDLQLRTLITAHTGKVCTIASHPRLPLFVSVSPDRSVRLWDAVSRRQLGMTRLAGRATCATFDRDGAYLAIGNELGELVVITCPVLQENASADVNNIRSNVPLSPRGEANGWEVLVRRNVGAKIARSQAQAQQAKSSKNRKKTKSEVVCMRFSPTGDILALACRDSLVHLLSVQNDFKRVGVCRGHSSHVTHLDFSHDGHVLMTNDAARDVLFWDIWDGGKIIHNGSRVRDVKWDSWTCVLGWSCQGLHGGTDSYQEDGEINAACRSKSNDVIVCGSSNTINGAVKLFQYPCLPGAVPKQYTGHMSPVQDIKFVGNDNYVVSAGGNDTCIFVWDHSSS